MFCAVVRGRYSAGPEILDGDAEVAYESVRPEKQRAELAVLHDLFLRWYEGEDARLRALVPFPRGSSVIYEVQESRSFPGEWMVGAIDESSEGEDYVALFSGPGAQQRAEEYAAWKNA